MVEEEREDIEEVRRPEAKGSFEVEVTVGLRAG